MLLKAAAAWTVAHAVLSPRAWGDVLLNESFNYPDGVITNEYAHYNPTAPDAVISSIWDMTSGSLFASGQQGWTGVPDNVAPNATSSNGNNSVVFHLLTKRTDFGDVSVSFTLYNMALTSSSTTPAQPWDGVSVALRYLYKATDAKGKKTRGKLVVLR